MSLKETFGITLLPSKKFPPPKGVLGDIWDS